MRWLLVVVAFATAACSWKVPRIGDAAPKLPGAQESAYQSTLERFTDRRELYDGFDTRVFAATTYLSEEFRRSKVKRKAAFERLPPEVEQNALEAELSEAAASHEFFFGVHANNMKWDDFDKANSVWRLALLTSGGEVIPVEKKRIGKGNEAMRAYFPYMDTFWVAYSLKFPKMTPNGEPTVPEGTEKLILRMSSTLGRTDFEVNAK